MSSASKVLWWRFAVGDGGEGVSAGGDGVAHIMKLIIGKSIYFFRFFYVSYFFVALPFTGM